MKQLFILFAFITLSPILSAQQVSNKNWTLIHERTADWCPFCGTWGWDMKTRILDQFKNDEVIFMAVHHSGGLNNPVSTAFSEHFGGIGQPIFFVDGVNINANSSNISTKIDETRLEVDFKKTLPAFAGVGIEANLNKTDNILTVNAKVEFFTDVEGGDYYLGLYLLEDVMNLQASRQGLQLHKNVLRRSLLNSDFGEALQKAPVNKGQSFTVSATVPNITSDRDKIKVVGILWNKVNNKYIFFNANQVNVGIPASDENYTTLNDQVFNAYQSESGNIIVMLNDVFTSANIMVTDITGKQLASKNIETGTIKNSVHSIQGAFVPGVHIVTLVNGTQRISKKIIIQ